ncbi:MAG: hypothetical protein AABW50_01280 [Nanoarchaeota archaeon]
MFKIINLSKNILKPHLLFADYDKCLYDLFGGNWRSSLIANEGNKPLEKVSKREKKTERLFLGWISTQLADTMKLEKT